MIRQPRALSKPSTSQKKQFRNMSYNGSHFPAFPGLSSKEKCYLAWNTSRNAMGYGLRENGTPFRRKKMGQGGEETSVPICHQRFVSVTPGSHGYFGHCPFVCKISLPRQGNEICRMKSSRIVAFSKSVKDCQTQRRRCGTGSLCRSASGMHSICWDDGRSLPFHPRRWGLEMAQ